MMDVWSSATAPPKRESYVLVSATDLVVVLLPNSLIVWIEIKLSMEVHGLEAAVAENVGKCTSLWSYIYRGHAQENSQKVIKLSHLQNNNGANVFLISLWKHLLPSEICYICSDIEACSFVWAFKTNYNPTNILHVNWTSLYYTSLQKPGSLLCLRETFCSFMGCQVWWTWC